MSLWPCNWAALTEPDYYRDGNYLRFFCCFSVCLCLSLSLPFPFSVSDLLSHCCWKSLPIFLMSFKLQRLQQRTCVWVWCFKSLLWSLLAILNNSHWLQVTCQLDSWAVVQENASNLLESATTDDCTVIRLQIIILHPKYKSTAVRWWRRRRALRTSCWT